MTVDQNPAELIANALNKANTPPYEPSIVFVGAIGRAIDQGANKDDINNTKDSGGRTAVHWSANNRYATQILSKLIENGADVNAQDNEGTTPLHCAASSGNNSNLKLLIDNGAQVNAKNEYGATPLRKAVSAVAPADTVSLLIKSGADVNIKGLDNKTALHLAVTHGDGVAQLLIENGADVNAQDDYGKTPLHYAVVSSRQNVAVISLLIEKGADLNAKDNNGKTPLDDAKTIGDKQITSILEGTTESDPAGHTKRQNMRRKSSNSLPPH